MSWTFSLRLWMSCTSNMTFCVHSMTKNRSERRARRGWRRARHWAGRGLSAPAHATERGGWARWSSFLQAHTGQAGETGWGSGSPCLGSLQVAAAGPGSAGARASATGRLPTRGAPGDHPGAAREQAGGHEGHHERDHAGRRHHWSMFHYCFIIVS